MEQGGGVSGHTIAERGMTRKLVLDGAYEAGTATVGTGEAEADSGGNPFNEEARVMGLEEDSIFRVIVSFL